MNGSLRAKLKKVSFYCLGFPLIGMLGWISSGHVSYRGMIVFSAGPRVEVSLEENLKWLVLGYLIPLSLCASILILTNRPERK